MPVLADIPKPFYIILNRLPLLRLFRQVPKWAT